MQDNRGLVLQPKTVHSKSYDPFPCELGSFRTSISPISHLKHYLSLDKNPQSISILTKPLWEAGLKIFPVDSFLDSKFVRLVSIYNSIHVHCYGNPSFLKTYSFVIILHSLSELQAFIYLLFPVWGNKLIQISVYQKDDNR